MTDQRRTESALEAERCPRCGAPSVSPPAEVYCVDCATGDWEHCLSCISCGAPGPAEGWEWVSYHEGEIECAACVAKRPADEDADGD